MYNEIIKEEAANFNSFKIRPIVVAVHPSLIEELKLRKAAMEEVTLRKTKGGLTNYSEMAAMELRILRQTGDSLFMEICKLKKPPIKKITEFGIEREYVPYEIFKKLYICASALYKKKDKQQFRVEVAKIKGQQKNEIKYIY